MVLEALQPKAVLLSVDDIIIAKCSKHWAGETSN